jgi:hypothetical protein
MHKHKTTHACASVMCPYKARILQQCCRHEEATTRKTPTRHVRRLKDGNSISAAHITHAGGGQLDTRLDVGNVPKQGTSQHNIRPRERVQAVYLSWAHVFVRQNGVEVLGIEVVESVADPRPSAKLRV